MWGTAMAQILLADDDAASRDLVARALQADGHSVTATQDGGEALDKLQASAGFELLVTDLHMPGMDGMTLANHVVAKYPAVRILLMSGFTDELVSAAGLLARPVVSIAKPFTLEQIRSAVRKALD